MPVMCPESACSPFFSLVNGHDTVGAGLPRAVTEFLCRLDDAERRPSHANRRKALRQAIMQNELLAVTTVWGLPTGHLG